MFQQKAKPIVIALGLGLILWSSSSIMVSQPSPPQGKVNIVYPIDGGSYPITDPALGGLGSAYITASFSVTCSGGPYNVSWGFDEGAVGSAQFYDQLSEQQVWKLMGGVHVFWVDAGTCGNDEVAFTVGQATTLAAKNVWVLDNADPDFQNPPFDDTLTVMGTDGTLINTMTGFNIAQSIGGRRALAVGPDGSYALVAETLASRLSRYDLSGEMRWSLNQKISAIDILDDTHAYALTTRGTIYGETLILLNPMDGTVMEEVEYGGFDLVVDRDHGAIWVVGADIKKLNLDDLELQFAIDPIVWAAMSVDFRSDGSAWVAEREHPDVAGSQNRILLIAPDGTVTQVVELNFPPMCLRVDRRDDSIWVTGGGRLHKFDKDGMLILSFIAPDFTLSVDQHDGSAWAAGYTGSITHYASDGEELLSVTGFSSDQTYVALP